MLHSAAARLSSTCGSGPPGAEYSLRSAASVARRNSDPSEACDGTDRPSKNEGDGENAEDDDAGAEDEEEEKGPSEGSRRVARAEEAEGRSRTLLSSWKNARNSAERKGFQEFLDSCRSSSSNWCEREESSFAESQFTTKTMLPCEAGWISLGLLNPVSYSV
jgi:hypothetical protein